MRRALVVGGASGIGLGLVCQLLGRPECERVYVVDRQPFPREYADDRVEAHEFDLTSPDYALFDRFGDIDTLILTAGFGRLALFGEVSEEHIQQSFAVNTVATLRILRRFYPLLEGREDFHCAVMGSIAGFLSSPFFAVYAATKAALRVFIESVNVELTKAGSPNRILNVSPGSIKGTGFYQGATDLELTAPLAREILCHMEAKDDLYIPQYDEVYAQVLARYQADFRAEGLRSYDYKRQQIDQR